MSYEKFKYYFFLSAFNLPNEYRDVLDVVHNVWKKSHPGTDAEEMIKLAYSDYCRIFNIKM